MPTPISGASPYCSASEALSYVDARVWGDSLGSEGRRLAPSEVVASTVMASLLQEASGIVESACLKGQRYLPDDLAALTGNSKRMLQGIVAGVACWLALQRRPPDVGAEKGQPRAKMAMEMLDSLAKGERIFGFTEHADAGLVDNQKMSAQQIEAQDLMVVQAYRFFGNRGNQGG